MQQHVYGVLHGAGFGYLAGVDEVDVIGVFYGVKAVGNNNFCGFSGKVFLK